jgi:hypothetical protein
MPKAMWCRVSLAAKTPLGGVLVSPVSPHVILVGYNTGGVLRGLAVAD